MAEVPYAGGAPTVAPDVQQPDDYERIQSSPANFGGLIAQGGEKLAEGASKAGQFFGEVQTDDAVNTAMTQVNKHLNDFRALRGADALSAQQPTQAAIDAAFKNGRDGLNTPAQQYQYDQVTRTFQQRYVSGIMSTHADEQAKEFATQTNNSSLKVALDGVTNVADYPDKVDGFLHDARQALVRQVQLEGNGSDPNTVKSAIARADQAVYKTQIETIAVRDPARAQRLVEQHKDDLGSAYYTLAGQIRSRADKQIGESAGNSAITGAPTQLAAQTGNPSAMIQHFEGYRSQPYWDVNHWRVGYGSDTVTRADGTVEPVTAATQVTSGDANRDLQRRTQLAQGQVKDAIGPQAWAAVGAPAQASLTSVTYNYGHVPNSVAAAARTGDPTAVAQAIVGLQGANGGVNDARRQQEADHILGRFTVPGGPSVLPAGGQAMQMPQAAAQPPGPPPFTMPEPGAPSELPQPAAYTPTAPSAPPTPLSPEEHMAAAVRSVEQRTDLTDDQKAYAVQHVRQTFTAAQIASEQDEKARKKASDEAADGVMKRIGNGDFANLVPTIANDPHMTWETKHTLMDVARRESGEENKASFGPGYADVYRRILLPNGDPDRISTQLDVLKMGGDGGPLTFAGTQKALTIMKEAEKSVDGYGLQRTKSSLIDYAKSKLSFEQDTGPIKIRDADGEAIFNSKFIPKFEGAYDAWVQAGKNPYEFLTQKNIDEIVKPLRDPRQMAADKVSAIGDATGETTVEVPPPPPEGLSPAGWTSVLQTRPIAANGKPWSYDNWAGAVNHLRADPSPENMKIFDAHFPNAPLKAKGILESLQPKAPEPPGPSIVERIQGFGDWLHTRPLRP